MHCSWIAFPPHMLKLGVPWKFFLAFNDPLYFSWMIDYIWLVTSVADWLWVKLHLQFPFSFSPFTFTLNSSSKFVFTWNFFLDDNGKNISSFLSSHQMFCILSHLAHHSLVVAVCVAFSRNTKTRLYFSTEFIFPIFQHRFSVWNYDNEDFFYC